MNGFVKRFHGLPRVPHDAPITECASHELLVGTRDDLATRAPKRFGPGAGSCRCRGAIRGILKAIVKHPAPIAFGGGVGFGIGGRRGMPALGGVRGSNR